jgi:hypothetical protein
MKKTSSPSRSTTLSLVSALLLALPAAMLAFPGCNGGVDEATTSTSGTSTSTGTVDGTSCSTDKPCPSGASCAFPPGSCAPGALGACQTVFQCDGPPMGPICGCDGKVIEGDSPSCITQIYDLSPPCQTGTFACGPTLTCQRNSDVCVEKVPGAPGPSTFECAAFGSVNLSCLGGIPACDCIDISKVGDPTMTTCKVDADNQETLTVTAP